MGRDVESLQGTSERHLDLQRHQIEAGHHLRHGVFDLQTCVHLEEVEGTVLVQDAFDGAGAHVTGLAGKTHRRLGEALADPVVDQRRRGLLDQLLVTALHRAVPVAEEEHRAARVGDDLRFHVVRAIDVPLQEHLGPSEVRLRLARGPFQRLLEVVAVADDVHALATAAERGLHQEREADPRSLFLRLRDVHRLGRAGNDGHAGGVGDPPGSRLVTHRLDGLRRRADEREAGLLDGASERRAFGEEAVAGMDQGGSGSDGRVHDRLDREVRGGGERRADPIRLVGHLHVEGVAVGVRVHRHGRDAHLAGRPHDPDGDLASVGDQEPRFARHSRMVPL